MDLISGISNFQQAKIFSQVQMKVARKMLDVQAFQGNAAVQLIEAAGREMQQGGDVLVAAATGLGGNLDTYA